MCTIILVVWLYQIFGLGAPSKFTVSRSPLQVGIAHNNGSIVRLVSAAWHIYHQVPFPIYGVGGVFNLIIVELMTARSSKVHKHDRIFKQAF